MKILTLKKYNQLKDFSFQDGWNKGYEAGKYDGKKYGVQLGINTIYAELVKLYHNNKGDPNKLKKELLYFIKHDFVADEIICKNDGD